MKVRGRLCDLFTQKYIDATLTVLREVAAVVKWEKPSIMRGLSIVQPLGDHPLSGSPDTQDYLGTTTQWPYAGHLSNIHEALSAAVFSGNEAEYSQAMEKGAKKQATFIPTLGDDVTELCLNEVTFRVEGEAFYQQKSTRE